MYKYRTDFNCFLNDDILFCTDNSFWPSTKKLHTVLSIQFQLNRKFESHFYISTEIKYILQKSDERKHKILLYQFAEFSKDKLRN